MVNAANQIKQSRSVPTEVTAPLAMHESEQVRKLTPSSTDGLGKRSAERGVKMRQQVVLGTQRCLRITHDVYGGWRV